MTQTEHGPKPTVRSPWQIYSRLLGYLRPHRAMFALGIAASWNAASLITFRVLASAAGAASGPASMALIYSVFPRERRVQAMGYWSMIGAGTLPLRKPGICTS